MQSTDRPPGTLSNQDPQLLVHHSHLPFSTPYNSPMQRPFAPEAEIRRRIRVAGPITFAEFMEVALYWPRGGYYSRGSQDTGPFGSTGDYYTSPMVHPSFGALLAVQLYQFWQLLDRPNPFHVVELGAGNGQLCRDILAAVNDFPSGFLNCLQYLCLDRSSGYGIRDLPAASYIRTDGIPLRNLCGCIISNELLDAFPVHQVRVENGELREVYIAEIGGTKDNSGTLVEVLYEPSSPALAARLEELGAKLAEGQTAEINLGMDGWARSVANALDAGFLLTIDFGRRAEELYSGELRPRGTLVTYYRHVQTDAPLRHIGDQDITAQVDFTSLVNAGRRAGLEPLGYTTQRQFLQSLGLDDFRRRLSDRNLSAHPEPVEGHHHPPAHPELVEGLGRSAVTLQDMVDNRAGMLALARIDGLGDFKVLVQSKNLPLTSSERQDLWGQEPSEEALKLVKSLPVPLLTDRHISLPQGWGQPAIQEFELTDLWTGPFGDT